MWTGTVGDCWTRMFCRSGWQAHITNILHDPSKQLGDVPLAVRAWMWYVHDGAPANFSRALRDDRRIGRGGPTAWPPRSTPNSNLCKDT
jgi:hypothetical protein